MIVDSVSLQPREAIEGGFCKISNKKLVVTGVTSLSLNQFRPVAKTKTIIYELGVGFSFIKWHFHFNVWDWNAGDMICERHSLGLLDDYIYFKGSACSLVIMRLYHSELSLILC